MRQNQSRPRLEVLHGHPAIRGMLGTIPTPMGYDPHLIWTRTDHLVIERDRTAGTHKALLAARYGTTGRDPFLLLDARAGEAITERTCRHMVAALLLRLAALEDLPAALVTHAENTPLAGAFQSIAASITDAAIYPIPESTVIPLRSAAMTQRIARTIGVPAWSGFGGNTPALVTLDLRSTFEDDLIPVLNKLFRQRAPNRAAASPRQRSARAS
jgi:hypothetical protein